MTKPQIIAILNKYATTPNKSGTKMFISADQINTIAGEIMKLNKDKKTFIPPTIDEVKMFFFENGYDPNKGIEAWHYYNDGDWKDSAGKPVLSWKQKIRIVWFKPEYRVDGNVNKSSNSSMNGMVL